VFDYHDCIAAIAGYPYPYRARVLCISHRVAEKVGEHLREPCGIAFDKYRFVRNVDPERVTGPVHQGLHTRDRIPHDIAQSDDRGGETELASVDSRYLQQVI